MKKFEYFEKLLFKRVAEEIITFRHMDTDADYIRLDTFFNLFEESKRGTSKYFRDLNTDDWSYGMCGGCGEASSKNRMFCSKCNAKIMKTIEK